MTDEATTKVAGYTPGPWSVDTADPEQYFPDVNVLRSDGLAVAVAVQNGDIMADQVKVNARLIAAAPTLLEALEELLDADPYDSVCAARENARRAITKATGAAP